MMRNRKRAMKAIPPTPVMEATKIVGFVFVEMSEQMCLLQTNNRVYALLHG